MSSSRTAVKVSLALGLAGSALLPVIVSSPEFVVTANVLLVYVAIMAIIAPWLYWGKTLLGDGAIQRLDFALLAICTSANALLEINVFLLDSTADSAFKDGIYLAGLITIGVGSALMMAMRNFKRQTTVAISSCAIAVPQYFLIFFILTSIQGGHSPEHFALFGIFFAQALSYLVSLALDFGYKSNVH